MVKIINRLLILDMLVLFLGSVCFILRPFGMDIACGIIMIAESFVFSIILFLVKLKITS